MTHVLAIARREIEERKFVFVAAFAIALVSPLALLMPYGSVSDRLSVIVPMSFLLGAAFTWGLALILGGTLVGRELSEKRLSFYFTRPISGAEVWFGKLIAASVLLVAAFVIVHAFSLGFGAREFRTMSTLSRSAVVGSSLGIAVGLMFAAHMLSTWVRSHSPILALDFILLILFVALVAVVILPLGLVTAVRPGMYILTALAAAVGIAGIGGGAWQLSRGRIDARRNHRELSLFLWTVVFAVVAGSFVYSRWVVGATPGELKKTAVNQRGAFLQMWGEARGARPSFVVDPATGAYLRGSSWLTEGVGNVVAETLFSPSLPNVMGGLLGKDVTIWTFRVARCERTCTVLMNLDFTGNPNAVSVTADGSRAALVSGGILTVYDVASRHAVASTHVGDVRPDPQFVSRDVIRIFTPLQGELRVTDFDVRTRKTTAVIPPVKLSNDYEYRVAGPLLLARNESGVEVHDLRNPQAVETIPLDKHDGVWLMRDGRRAIFHRRGPASIEIRRNGVQERVIRVGPDTATVRVSAEIGRGKLLVSTNGATKGDVTVSIVDADTGAVSAPISHSYVAGPWPADLGITEPDVNYRALQDRITGKIDIIDLRTGTVKPLSFSAE